MTSLAGTAGLGVGALFAGIVALAIPDAAAGTVWIVLIALMSIGTLLAVLTPETSARRPGALAALKPHVSVPPRARRLFAVTTPTIAAIFLTTALFLGLIPGILISVFRETDPLVSGGLNFVMFAVATAASGLTGAVRPHRLRMAGGLAMVLAAILLLGGVAAHVLPLIWGSAVLAGAGSGAALAGSTRGLVPQVEPHERAGVIGAATMSIGYAILLAVVALAGLASAFGLSMRGRTAATTAIPTT
jgi:hypothetical protein